MNRLRIRPLALVSRIQAGVRRLSSNPHAYSLGLDRDISLKCPAYVVWGAGTDVGKTIISAGICNASSQIAKSAPIFYYKPVQTGFPQDSDSDVVASICGGVTEFGNHACELLVFPEEIASFPEMLSSGQNVTARTEFAWNRPISPHLAAKQERRHVTDDVLLRTITEQLSAFSQKSVAGSVAFIETAGGVASPAPSGNNQCDVLRELRLPGILVGDGRVGGISATMTAMESLLLRGMDVAVIVLQDNGMANDMALQDMLRRGAYGRYGTGEGREPAVVVLPPLPKRRQGNSIPQQALRSWILQSDQKLRKVATLLQDAHKDRLARLAAAPQQGLDRLWFPFTQHTDLQPKDFRVIDSRQGDSWYVHKEGNLMPMLDASASWWTQGLGSAMQGQTARSAAYSAARYGHIILPGNVHAPALEAARLLIEGPGSGWASKVFFTDNGAAAVEVAIKMGLRTFMRSQGLLEESGELSEEGRKAAGRLSVLGLKGSYHGDTLGAMDAQAPSVFNQPNQSPWYTNRGVWLEPSTLFMRKGQWEVSLPVELRGHADLGSGELTFATRAEAFDLTARMAGGLARVYREYVVSVLDKAALDSPGDGPVAASLIIEPIVHGAAGMDMIDPLLQRILVEEARLAGLPVIFDEIFAGLWRLGRLSSASYLGVQPDIACYGKLLTGGTLSLAATLAAPAVFRAFLSADRGQALLHGHSYTANPIACAAAATALDRLADPASNPNLPPGGGELRELWPMEAAEALSWHPAVGRVVMLGTLLAVQLAPQGAVAGGYKSDRAAQVVSRLGEAGIAARPLGDVVYLLASPTASPAQCCAAARVAYHAFDNLSYGPGPSAPSPI